MLDTVEINHVQHISFAQSRLTDAVSVILSELLSYEHPSNRRGGFLSPVRNRQKMLRLFPLFPVIYSSILTVLIHLIQFNSRKGV